MSAVPYVRVLISPELKEQFSQIAAHQDRAVSQVLRDLMREYIWLPPKLERRWSAP